MKTLKKTLCLALAVVLAVGVLVIPANADKATWDGFTDKDDADIKYEEALGTLTGMGIINGKSSTELQPGAYVTRAEAVVMIVRALMGGSSWTVPQTATKFTDVPASHYASGYVAYAVELGIIAGKTETEFMPDDYVTGYELARMALVAAGLKKDFNPNVWQIESATLSFRKGLLVGLEAITDLNKTLTRAEAAQLLFNTVKYDEVVNGVHTGIGATLYSLDQKTEGVTDDFGRPSIQNYNTRTDEVYYQGNRQGIVEFYVTTESLTVETLLAKLGLSNGSGLTAKVVVNGNHESSKSLDNTKTVLQAGARGAHVYVYNGTGTDAYEVYVNYTYAAYFKSDVKGGAVTKTESAYCNTSLGFDVTAKTVAIFDYNSKTGKAFNAQTAGATKTGAQITRKSNDANDPYIYVDGAKTYLSAKAISVTVTGTVSKLTQAAVAVGTAKYDVYYDNAGNVIALVAQAAAAPSKDVNYDNFGYVLAFSCKAAINGSGTDMGFTSVEAQDAQARVLMVDIKTGAVSVYTVAVTKDSDGKWKTLGVDGKTTTGVEISTNKTSVKTDIHGFVAYKKLESGSFGITVTDNLADADSTNQGYAVATSFTTNKNGLITVDGNNYYANSATEVLILNSHTTDAANNHVGSYTVTSYTGYKSLDGITAVSSDACKTHPYETLGVGALFVVDTDTNIVTKAYVFTDDFAAHPATTTYDYYMFVKAGDTTVDGTELVFIHNGVTEIISSATITNTWTALVAGKVYVGTVADGKTTLSDPAVSMHYASDITDVTGFVNENGVGFVADDAVVYALADGCYIIDAATKTVTTDSPKGKKVVVYFADDSSTKTIALIVIQK